MKVNIQGFANHLHEDRSRETSLSGPKTFHRNQVQLCKPQLVVLSKLNDSAYLEFDQSKVSSAESTVMFRQWLCCCDYISDHNYSNHNHSKIYGALWV